MALFFSKNNTEPYEIIDDVNQFMVDGYIFDKDVIYWTGQNIGEGDVIYIEGYFYVIATDEIYTNVKVKVNYVYDTGVDLKISLTDYLGNPIEFKREVNIGYIDASAYHQKYLLKYRWYVLNNIFFNKIGHKIATLIITSEI